MPSTDCTPFKTRQDKRRCQDRYPVSAELQFRVTGNQPQAPGAGVAVNLSNNGILFWTPEVLQAGQPIEMDVIWPDSHSERGIQLHIQGRTVRVEGNYTAVHCQELNFQLRQANLLPVNLR